MSVNVLMVTLTLIGCVDFYLGLVVAKVNCEVETVQERLLIHTAGSH